MSVIIYGASDDLIEVDGDIYEEFGHNTEDPALLALSDGTVLRVVHDEDGIWRITPVALGTATMIHEFGKDDRQHSDKATFNGDIRWVVYGSAMATKKAES